MLDNTETNDSVFSFDFTAISIFSHFILMTLDSMHRYRGIAVKSRNRNEITLESNDGIQ